MGTLKRKSEFVFRAFAGGFGAGHMPLAPGTWGALEGIVLVYAIGAFFPAGKDWILVGATLILGVLAVFASDRVARSLKKSDPQEIVADEIVGQMICFLWIPVTPANLLVGFALFRIFDISKPFPAGRAEHLPGGLGIIADDVVAGLYAGIALRIMAPFLV